MQTIKAGNFYEFVKCPRKVYLHFFGDKDKKAPYSEFMQKKFEQGKNYESEIVKNLEFEQPEEDIEEQDSFKQTLNFMKKGAKLIYQGWLIDENLVGIPDLLQKTKGKSELGNYHYEICDIKLSTHVREEYVMQIMFYSYLLFKVQGVMPKKTHLWLGNGEKVEIDVQENFNRFSELLKRIKEIASGIKEPVNIAGICKDCPWKNVCLEQAKKDQDLSLIYNLSRPKNKTLKNLGVKNLKQASEMDAEELGKVRGLTPKSLNKYKMQAQSLLTKKAIRLNQHKFPKDKAIFFDIEDTEVDSEKIVYLFGLISDNKYIALLAETPQQEKKIWKEFLNFFKTLENFKLYVYSHHEQSMLKKLFRKYEGDEETYKKINENIIDLFAVIKDVAVLPIYAYTIKDVAKYFGFKWSAQDAGGAQSMVWYDKWLEKKNKRYLNEVLRYNEEDCKAMIVVKDWIENK